MTIPHSPTLPEIAGGDDPTLRVAYWDAIALLDAGWQLRKMRFVAATGAGAVDLCTPTHRGVTVESTDRARRHLNLPNSHLAVRLAQAVAILGARGDDSLADLSWQLSAHSPGPKPLVNFGHAHIPDPELSRQPVNLRTAYWLLTVLVCDYQWRLHSLGEEYVGGGFIADIPRDLTVIYPASTTPDGTAAAALARLLPSLDPSSLHYLRLLDPVMLAKTRATALRRK